MRDPMILLSRAYGDARLSALDKSIYAFLVINMDQVGEYRHGKSYLSRRLPAGEHTVARSFKRLTECGYVAERPIGASRWSTWYVLEGSAAESDPPTRFESGEAPRMAMPVDRAASVMRYLLDAKQRLLFGLTSDMQVPEDQRLIWLTESDYLDDLIEEYARWMGRFGGGVPEAIKARLGS